MDAVRVVELAATAIVSVPVVGLAVVTLMFSGFGVQVMPTAASEVAAVVDVQVTPTMPVKPPLGVTVIVEVPLLPAVMPAGVVPVTV